MKVRFFARDSLISTLRDLEDAAPDGDAERSVSGLVSALSSLPASDARMVDVGVPLLRARLHLAELGLWCVGSLAGDESFERIVVDFLAVV